VHVLRNVHQAVRPGGLVLEIHPLGIDIPIRAGSRGLGFIEASDFAVVVEGVDAAVDALVAEGTLEDCETRKRHIVERFDTADEAVEELSTWDDLRPSDDLLDQVRTAEERPIDLVETIGYRLLRRV